MLSPDIEKLITIYKEDIENADAANFELISSRYSNMIAVLTKKDSSLTLKDLEPITAAFESKQREYLFN